MNIPEPTDEMLRLTMALMPEPIPSLIAENGRLSRLIRPVAKALELGKPDNVSEDYWVTFSKYHDAMVTQKEFVSEMLEGALEEHKQELIKSDNPIEMIMNKILGI